MRCGFCWVDQGLQRPRFACALSVPLLPCKDSIKSLKRVQHNRQNSNDNDIKIPSRLFLHMICNFVRLVNFLPCRSPLITPRSASKAESSALWGASNGHVDSTSYNSLWHHQLHLGAILLLTLHACRRIRNMLQETLYPLAEMPR